MFTPRGHATLRAWLPDGAPHGRLLLPLLALLGTGCMSYQAAPLDTQDILHTLETLEWPGLETNGEGSPFSGDDGAVTPAQLAAFAIVNNPTLRAARAEIGVSEALLLEARLFPEPVIGWDAGNVLGAEFANEPYSNGDVLAGFQMFFPIPRPGELDSRGDAAEWHLSEARWRVASAEWQLAREVYLAAEESAGAARLAELGEALVAISARTQATFQRARETGAVTSVSENIASGELLSMELRSIQLTQGYELARQHLNALMGLPPRSLIPVRATLPGELPELPADDPDALVELGLEHRPDLAELMASYQAAEQMVRYEIARQWPELSIGTGIFLVPQLFSHGNRPAIRAAMERRERLAREVESRVHQIRAEIHSAWTSHEQAQRVVEFLGQGALPNAEEGLRLAGEALSAGGATVLEILALQRNLIDVRVRFVEAEIELARKGRVLLAATGMLPDGSDSIASDSTAPDSIAPENAADPKETP